MVDNLKWYKLTLIDDFVARRHGGGEEKIVRLEGSVKFFDPGSESWFVRSRSLLTFHLKTN